MAISSQVSWQKIRNELQRLSDVDELRSEVQRISKEIRKFDFHSVLSPTAQAKVKMFEKRYAVLMRSLHKAQRQVDRELNRVVRNLHTHRSDVSTAFNQQKQKLEKITADFQKRFGKATKGKKKAPLGRKAKTTAKKSARTSTRKGRKA
jgi:hypothetical protein